ncbi:MAG: hypothetical protein HY927_14945 [Elusimicrobia bacterium]|nr:hypothetical protein [Elusimicrobiota bacterium]
MMIMACWVFLAFPVRADDYAEMLLMEHRIRTETADRIQERIVDPILGKGEASVFVKMELEARREREHSERWGMGVATREKNKAEKGSAAARSAGSSPASVSTRTVAAAEAEPEEDLFKGFGFGDGVGGAQAKRPAVAGENDGHSSLQRESRQTKGIDEERYAVKTVFRRYQVVIIHEKKVPSERLKMVRDAVADAFSPELSPDNIVFRAVEFSETGPR